MAVVAAAAGGALAARLEDLDRDPVALADPPPTRRPLSCHLDHADGLVARDERPPGMELPRVLLVVRAA
jgi:hypothetical protein